MYKEMKILISVTIILFICCLVFLSNWISTRQQIKSLEKEMNNLQLSLKQYNDSQDVATKTIVKIQEKIKYVKEDCYNQPISNDIIEFVRGTKK